MMNLREAKEFVERNFHIDATIQGQPYTATRLVIPDPTNPPYELIGRGFSKVSWPDTWDATRGINYALKRAKRDLVRQLVKEG